MPRLSRAGRISRYKNLVREAIVSCPNCQAFDDGVVWVVGRQTELDDVLDDCGVPADEGLRREIIAGIDCPGCGDSISAHLAVGIRFPFEMEHDAAIARADRRFGSKLLAFAGFLERFPMLGASHPLGRRLLKDIVGFPRAKLEQATWFRARRIASGRQFTSDDLRLPDPDSVLSPGRFNHLGQAHWYLANSEDTAVREVVDQEEEIAWLQKWTVGPIEPVLDLVSFGADDPFPVTEAKAKDLPLLAAAMIFGGHLNRPADRRSGWKPEYFVPHYVADAAKSGAFKGIRFNSTKGLDVNLVIFDKDAPVKPDGEPTLHNWKADLRDSPF